jgi:succinyl-diaminopimelate desuccinylase
MEMAVQSGLWRAQQLVETPETTRSTMNDELVATISAEVDAREAEIVEALCELVRIPTPTPPGENYDRIVDTLISPFRDLGFEAQRYDLPAEVFESRCRVHHPELAGPRANLLASRTQPGRPQMAFYCHLDTVPIGDRSKWSVKPTVPMVKDGYVWGRGTADSKGGAVAILSAMRVLTALSIDTAVSPIVALTTDEEIGPYTGLMYMADSGVFDACRWFFSCDGMADSIGIGATGAFTWAITVRGQSAHSGRAFMGVNAIEHGTRILQELLETKGEIETRRSELATSPEIQGLTSRSRMWPALNVTIGHGGVKHNIIPDEFVIEGDRRYLPEEDERDCIDELQEALKRARARDKTLDCELDITPFYPAFMRDVGDPWLRRIQTVVEAIRGHAIPMAGIAGSTDVAHVANIARMGIAANGLARINDTRNHAPDERCRIDDLLALTKIVAVLAASNQS